MAEEASKNLCMSQLDCSLDVLLPNNQAVWSGLTNGPRSGPIHITLYILCRSLHGGQRIVDFRPRI